MSDHNLSRQHLSLLNDFFRRAEQINSDDIDEAAWQDFQAAWQALEQLETISEQTVCRVGIPHLPAHFTGRSREIQGLYERVAVHNTVAITAAGASGGMGKTTLAQAFVEDLDSPFETVLWTDVTPSPDPAHILRTWAQQLNRAEAIQDGMNLNQMIQRMREVFTGALDTGCGGRALIVLDDVWENGLDAVEIIRSITPSGTKFLITTRRDAVASSAESVFSLDDLAQDESARLVSSLISHSALVQPYLDEILELLPQHPLTLELAGSLLNQQSRTEDLAALLAAWKQDLEAYQPSILWPEDADVPPALDVMLRHIYAALPDTTRTLFRALGIIAPELSWDLSLITQLVPDLDAASLAQDLRLLLDYRLVRDDTRDGQAQHGYRQHALVHQYASALLAQADETTVVFERYAAQVIPHAIHLQTNEMREWQQAAPYIPHLHHIGDELLYLHKNSIALARHADTFARHITSYLEIYRKVKRREWLEMGMNANRLISRHQDAVYLANIAMDHATRGEFEDAVSGFNQAIEVFRELNDPLELAKHINSLGFVFRHQGHAERALEQFKEALVFARRAGDENVLSAIFNNFGGYHVQHQQYDEAFAYYERARDAAQRGQDVHQEATAWNNLAHVLIQQGRFADAIPYLESALEITTGFDGLSSRASALSNLGKAHHRLGQHTDALRYYQLALDIDLQSDDSWGQVFSYNNLGQLHTDLKQPEAARGYYEKALLAAKKVKREDFVERIQKLLDDL